MPDPDSQRLEVRLNGRVQGVGFRHFATVEARRRRLSGFVRNERDGTVTAIAEGPSEDLADWLDALRDGPPSARIDNLETDWGDSTGEFEGFGVGWS